MHTPKARHVEIARHRVASAAGPGTSAVERFAAGIPSGAGKTGLGVTVLSTVELEDTYTSLRFSPHGTAFLMDAIVMQRYVEIDGELHRAISVVKVRASRHSDELREYAINASGLIVVGGALRGFDGLLSGRPALRRAAPASIPS